MGDAILKKYMYNGQLLDVATFDEKYKAINPSVYEVVRIMDGKPLFLEEHYARLVNSTASVGAEPGVTLEELRQLITNMASENGVKNHNIKLVLNGVNGKKFDNFYLFMLHTSYPTEEMYKNGVKTDLFEAIRNNPQAKIIDQSLRDRENEFMKEHELFEAILVNDQDEITEGSRSNIFFIAGGEVITAPAEAVLLGVTRQRVIRICEENGIKVHQIPVTKESLEEYEAAFISGTSPKCLPIANIGHINLDVNNETLRKIMALYDNEIAKSLAK